MFIVGMSVWGCIEKVILPLTTIFKVSMTFECAMDVKIFQSHTTRSKTGLVVVKGLIEKFCEIFHQTRILNHNTKLNMISSRYAGNTSARPWDNDWSVQYVDYDTITTLLFFKPNRISLHVQNADVQANTTRTSSHILFPGRKDTRTSWRNSTHGIRDGQFLVLK